MSWLQLHLTVDKARAAEAEARMEELGALSVTLTDAEDEPMLEPPPGETPVWTRTRVTGLFPGDTETTALRRRLEDALGAEVFLEPLEDQPWERAWLDHFRPMRFGDRLWICPSGQEVEAEGAVVVELDPGLAFGTGTHPTTALCLQWLDGANLEGRHVIDYGCGSGILGIAALKLGAAEVIAVDHDPQALAATRENARRNGVAERLRTLAPGEPLPGGADLLLANILANVLVELAPTLAPLLPAGGELVLSGILEEQAEEVARAYAPRFEFAPWTSLEGWVRLDGVKR
ncbi:MAG TPA: 50S ribosomal protein L11 methyltransferase [Thiolapillus brandeum]|uniref:Ribosomal protein L11 methyltransferase n=1 Tax=Thiolapillus brandeum TaxID=1076588 RepID=A0A7C5MVC4_9GAMM|nr:50S ribosomal protein L11 methyltransferase [Thiolapillus brandeum]